ncbi:MAG: peptidase T [Aeromonadaceae bacterium]
MQNLLPRFFRYLSINTQADERHTCCPSTPGQTQLAELLAHELRELGLDEVVLDDNGYLTARLPANTPAPIPPIGFIAHMDTAPDFTGHQVQPQLVECYQGGDIALGKGQEVLSPREFPSLRQYVGQDLITTDGTTLLGADDKAGIAAIITAMEYLLAHPEILHGDIHIGFTPDEEIGRGADLFPLERFPAQWAYTVDGGELGELEYENFNAATAVVHVRGNSVHPGTAKGIMVNSQTLAAQFHSQMPAAETPETTEGYEGFYHLIGTQGSVEESQLTYIIRDFSSEGLAARQRFLLDRVSEWNQQLDQPRFSIAIKESYRNMREQILPYPHIIAIAKQAMQEVGITAKIKPIRGGTDGSRLSFMGLPCPNLFTGGHNFHGKHEYLPVPSLQKSVATLVAIARLTVTHSSRN